MNICFTSQNPTYAFHVYNTKKDILDSIAAPKQHAGASYGITWDRKYLYISCLGRILRYDKKFKYKGIALEHMRHGTHQILYHQHRLFLAQTNYNCIQIYNMRKNQSRYFHADTGNFTDREPIADSDVQHFNSLLIANNLLYVSAHNYDEPSFVKVFTWPKLEYVQRAVMGRKIHGIAVKNGDIYTADSAGSRHLINNSGDMIDIGATRNHFVKGLMMTEDTVAAGYSPKKGNRLERATCHSTLAWKDKTGIKKVKFNRMGLINEVRCLDHYDYAHGVDPFMIPS